MEKNIHSLDLNDTMKIMADLFCKDSEAELGWAVNFRTPGLGCLKSVDTLKAKNRSFFEQPEWWKCVDTSMPIINGKKVCGQGGSGAPMRVHPAGITFADDPKKAEEYAVAQAYLTHSAPIAIAASAAQAVGVALLISGEKLRSKMQESYIDMVVKRMIRAAERYYHETACLIEAHQQGLKHAPLFACDQYIEISHHDKSFKIAQPILQKWQGWDSRTAIAAVIYLFTALQDYDDELAGETAIQRGLYTAVNSVGDNTLACMIDALLGAHFGNIDFIPKADQSKIERVNELKQIAINLCSNAITNSPPQISSLLIKCFN